MTCTFSSNIQDASTTRKEEPCLCAQNAECFSEAFRGGVKDCHREELRICAFHRCPMCKGSGVELVNETDAPYLNLANDNASRLLGVLGLSSSLMGEMTLPEARRALMRARARTSLTPFTRSSETLHGQPSVNEDGTVTMKPVRVCSFGLTEEKLEEYIVRFAAFVEESAQRGAITIYWA